MDLTAVEMATKEFLASGMRVMHAFMLDETEQGHVAKLLAAMSPPPDAVVLDAGCGVGAVAAEMQTLRPDLRFKLLNVSELQLSYCPASMERILASFDDIPLPDCSVNVVMFNFALCHANDWEITLREARRVLKESGTLFVFDFVRRGGDNDLMSKLLGASAYPGWMVSEVAQRAGFQLMKAEVHYPRAERLREVMGPSYDLVVGDVLPGVLRFERRTRADPIEDAIARHQRVAFQFSGGRDSTAALYLLREHWSRMTVYHLDTGDQFPETREVVRQVEADMGVQMTRIAGDVEAVRDRHGWASDIVPVDNGEIGRKVSGREMKIISRYECCSRALMQPMHDRMVSDGITLIVRGQRDDEYASPPLRSGAYSAGFEVLYPIQAWTAEQVDAYIAREGLPVAPFYARGVRRAPECMGCTAWWDEGRAGYMREHHPIRFERYRQRMAGIRAEIDRQYQTLDT